MSKERKVKSVQKYTFEIVHYEDGYSVINRTNEGFPVVEMLGICEIVKHNMMEILKSVIREPDEENIQSSNSPTIHEP